MMAYILGIAATCAAIWAFTHDGTESPSKAKQDWQVAGVVIIALGTIAGSLLL